MIESTSSTSLSGSPAAGSLLNVTLAALSPPPGLLASLRKLGLNELADLALLTRQVVEKIPNLSADKLEWLRQHQTIAQEALGMSGRGLLNRTDDSPGGHEGRQRPWKRPRGRFLPWRASQRPDRLAARAASSEPVDLRRTQASLTDGEVLRREEDRQTQRQEQRSRLEELNQQIQAKRQQQREARLAQQELARQQRQARLAQEEEHRRQARLAQQVREEKQRQAWLVQMEEQQQRRRAERVRKREEREALREEELLRRRAERKLRREGKLADRLQLHENQRAARQERPPLLGPWPLFKPPWTDGVPGRRGARAAEGQDGPGLSEQLVQAGIDPALPWERILPHVTSARLRTCLPWLGIRTLGELAAAVDCGEVPDSARIGAELSSSAGQTAIAEALPFVPAQARVALAEHGLRTTAEVVAALEATAASEVAGLGRQQTRLLRHLLKRHVLSPNGQRRSIVLVELPNMGRRSINQLRLSVRSMLNAKGQGDGQTGPHGAAHDGPPPPHSVADLAVFARAQLRGDCDLFFAAVVEQKTHAALAARQGLSRERIRQIILRTGKRMRERMAAYGWGALTPLLAHLPQAGVVIPQHTVAELTGEQDLEKVCLLLNLAQEVPYRICAGRFLVAVRKGTLQHFLHCLRASQLHHADSQPDEQSLAREFRSLVDPHTDPAVVGQLCSALFDVTPDEVAHPDLLPDCRRVQQCMADILRDSAQPMSYPDLVHAYLKREYHGPGGKQDRRFLLTRKHVESLSQYVAKHPDVLRRDTDLYVHRLRLGLTIDELRRVERCAQKTLLATPGPLSAALLLQRIREADIPTGTLNGALLMRLLGQDPEVVRVGHSQLCHRRHHRQGKA